MTAPIYSDVIASLLAHAAGDERSAVLALEALVRTADETGAATLNDIAIGYREEYLRTLREEGKDAQHEAGRLSLDEVRSYLRTWVLPRLANDGVIVIPPGDVGDYTRLRLSERLWSDIAPLRAQVADMLRRTGEFPRVAVQPVPAADVIAGQSTLEAQGLVKIYRRRRVVNDVALHVSQGEIVGLLGPNGAGKTTTFYMLVGLIEPLEGHIRLDGEDITDMPMYQRARRGIGYLSQEPSIFRKLSVEDNIMAILETLPISDEERQERLERLLDELSIRRLRKSKAYALSGGERRRLEITRALVTDPKFMMLDEPFAGVDPIAVHDIQTIVSGLRQRNIGVLISDHNVEQTLDIVDRAYIMFDGQVKVSGTVRDLVFDDTVAKIYLGPTLTARLRERFAGERFAGAGSGASL
jgi:lipopolysaccharide export system ATP-binding protein